jgi:hypothetical protein
MKIRLSILLLILSSNSLSAQDEFDGWWESKTSKYITIIYVGDYGVARVLNYNPFNENVIEERILKSNKNSFLTHLFNPENGYSVKIKYKMKDENNLICKFKGDLNKTVNLKRSKFEAINNKYSTVENY